MQEYLTQIANIFNLNYLLIKKDKLIRIISIIFLGINLSIWLLAYLLFYYLKVEKEITLHYNIYFGIDLIGSKWQLFYLPIAGIIIIILNALIALLIYNKNQFMIKILAVSTLLAQLFILLSIISIAYINLY